MQSVLGSGVILKINTQLNVTQHQRLEILVPLRLLSLLGGDSRVKKIQGGALFLFTGTSSKVYNVCSNYDDIRHRITDKNSNFAYH